MGRDRQFLLNTPMKRYWLLWQTSHNHLARIASLKCNIYHMNTGIHHISLERSYSNPSVEISLLQCNCKSSWDKKKEASLLKIMPFVIRSSHFDPAFFKMHGTKKLNCLLITRYGSLIFQVYLFIYTTAPRYALCTPILWTRQSSGSEYLWDRQHRRSARRSRDTARVSTQQGRRRGWGGFGVGVKIEGVSMLASVVVVVKRRRERLYW